MANFQQQENMLLTEHFSWPPISLIDDIINTINEVLYRCTDTFATGIASAPPQLLGFADRYAAESRTPGVDANGDPVFPDAALELDEGVLKLETLMENAVDKNFDKLEIWTLRNVLCLPRGEEELARWVRLAHYAGLDVEGEGEAEGKRERWTPETLYALRRKLIETQKLNAALLAEKRRNEALLAQLKALLNPDTTGVGVKSEDTAAGAAMESTVQSSSAGKGAAAFAFLTHTPSSQSLGVLPITASTSASTSTSTSTSTTTPATATATAPPTTQTPLATHSSFTTSHLPHLRHLLSTLRPHLSSTSTSTSASTSASQDRKTYLESQSKRILERRGVDTKDGVEGAVEGGRVRGDEVRGLEALVAAGGFGRGRGVGGGKGDGDGKGVGGNTEGEEGKGDGMDLS